MGDLLKRKSIRLLINCMAGVRPKRVRNREAVEEIRRRGDPLIILFWHRHIFTLIHHFRGSGARPLISRSSDGDLVAGVAREFGLDPIRGSSSKGGAAAFLTMMRSLQVPGTEILITADGPRGPARRMKPGTLELARRTGAWVVPVSWYARPVHVFKRSWDRFLLPLPGSRIHLAYGQPLPPDALSAGIDEEEMRHRLDDLEAGLIRELYGNKDPEEKA